ncbi:MAG: AzlC family ABC transporter permease [Alphaproteobacteria bacterium]|nr:AzlC family ABC transporter permease [Alphaproteobacteria bacterium]
MSDIDFKTALRRGARDAIGIPAIILIGSMTGYGALAHDSGFGVGLAVLSTVLIWGLPGQIAMAELYSAGADLLAIAIAVAMANMRFFPMAVSLLPTFGAHSDTRLGRVMQAQLMSATSWAYIMRSTAPRAAHARVGYHIGFAAVCLICAAASTALGHYGASGLPQPLALALLFLNACFLLILLVDVREHPALVSIASGVVVGIPANIALPDTGLIVTGVVGGTIGFLVGEWRGRAQMDEERP